MLQFTFNAYVDQLKALGHKDLPTSAEFAKLLGITPTSFSRLAQNKQDGPSRKQLGIIIAAFKERGIKATPNDFLQWVDRSQ
jgi:hypothetical protein